MTSWENAGRRMTVAPRLVRECLRELLKFCVLFCGRCTTGGRDLQTNLMVRLYSRTWVSTVFCRFADVKSLKRKKSGMILKNPRPVNWAEYSGSINICLGIANPKSVKNHTSLRTNTYVTLNSWRMCFGAKVGFSFNSTGSRPRDSRMKNKKLTESITAQLVLDIAHVFFVLQSQTPGTLTRKRKRSENVRMEWVNPQPSVDPSFSHIANMSISCPLKEAKRRRLSVCAGT